MRRLERHPKSGDIYVVEYAGDQPVGLSDSLCHKKVEMIMTGNMDINDIDTEPLDIEDKEYVGDLLVI